MMNYDDPVVVVAEYICVDLHPKSLRAPFVRHMRSSYKADYIVYVLQALAQGMCGIFMGLLTNYLYDRAKKKHGVKKRKNISRLVKKQKKTIKELEALIARGVDYGIRRQATSTLTLQKRLVFRLEFNDPSLASLIRKAIDDLDNKGPDALFDHVESHRDTPNNPSQQTRWSGLQVFRHRRARC